MPIVTNWAEPLENAVRAKLSDPANKDYASFQQAQRLAALLDGTPQSAELARLMDEWVRRLEDEYQSTVGTIRQSASYTAVEAAINELERFRGYKAIEALIAEGNERVTRMRQEEQALEAAAKKRRRIRTLAIVAVAAIVIAFFLAQSIIINRRTNARIAEVKAMVEAGRSDEAIEAIVALAKEGVSGEDYHALYETTEAILEKKAREEGYEAAFELRDTLKASAPISVDDDDFPAYATSVLKDEAGDSTERWSLLMLLKRRGEKVSTELGKSITGAYIADKPAGEAWAAVVEAVEAEALDADEDIAAEAFNNAVAEADGAQAWEIARKGVALKVVRSEDEAVVKAFNAYVASLSPSEAWSTVYAAQRDKTVAVDNAQFVQAYSAHVQQMDAVEAWAEYAGFDADGMTDSFPEDTRKGLLDKCLAALTAQLAEAGHRDMNAWAEENQALMNKTAANPDTLLAFLYALNDAGYDVAALFPDNVRVDIPVAQSVRSLISRILSDDESTDMPNMTTVLPVYIEERGYELDDCGTASRIGIDSSTAEIWISSAVTQMQSRDDHYRVYLLTKYLFRIPEDMRPAAYAQCCSLLCMETVYQNSGTITHESNFGVGKNVTYKPFFSEIDMVAVYDMREADCGVRLYTGVNKADVEDDDWFNAHKKDSMVLLTGHMRGDSDMNALEAQYEQVLDEVDKLMLYTHLINSEQEGDTQ